MSTCVFFFGGYNATETDMKIWLGSAKAQKTDVQFNAYPWPSGAASDGSSAVTAFTKAGRYASAIAAVQSSAADRIYLVGHSSGCAIANAVDRGLKDPSKIVLVALDGFSPDQKQLARSSTQVWAAECDGHVSRNYKSLKKYTHLIWEFLSGVWRNRLRLHYHRPHDRLQPPSRRARQSAGGASCDPREAGRRPH